jgi:hypothetical protein
MLLVIKHQAKSGIDLPRSHNSGSKRNECVPFFPKTPAYRRVWLVPSYRGDLAMSLTGGPGARSVSVIEGMAF